MKFSITIEFDSPNHLETYCEHVFGKNREGVQIIYRNKLKVTLTNTDDIAKFFGHTLGLIGIAMIHEAWNSEEGLELQASLRRAVRLQTTFVIVVWTEPVLQPDPEEEKSRPVGPSPVGDPGPDDDDDDKPFAMGLDTHLREFAAQHNATSFHDFTPEQKRNWKPEVLERLDDPKQELLVNLQDVKVWEGQTNLARNLGGSTDWELNEIRKREHIWGRIEWWDGHKKVDNPFDPPVSDPSESPGADPNEPPEEDTNG